jgi:hypothetical protein
MTQPGPQPSQRPRPTEAVRCLPASSFRRPHRRPTTNNTCTELLNTYRAVRTAPPSHMRPVYPQSEHPRQRTSASPRPRPMNTCAAWAPPRKTSSTCPTTTTAQRPSTPRRRSTRRPSRVNHRRPFTTTRRRRRPCRTSKSTSTRPALCWAAEIRKAAPAIARNT